MGGSPGRGMGFGVELLDTLRKPAVRLEQGNVVWILEGFSLPAAKKVDGWTSQSRGPPPHQACGC